MPPRAVYCPWCMPAWEGSVVSTKGIGILILVRVMRSGPGKRREPVSDPYWHCAQCGYKEGFIEDEPCEP